MKPVERCGQSAGTATRISRRQRHPRASAGPCFSAPQCQSLGCRRSLSIRTKPPADGPVVELTRSRGHCVMRVVPSPKRSLVMRPTPSEGTQTTKSTVRSGATEMGEQSAVARQALQIGFAAVKDDQIGAVVAPVNDGGPHQPQFLDRRREVISGRSGVYDVVSAIRRRRHPDAARVILCYASYPFPRPAPRGRPDPGRGWQAGA